MRRTMAAASAASRRTLGRGNVRRRKPGRPPAAARGRSLLVEPLECRVLFTADDQISEAILTSVGSTINSNIDVNTDVDMYRVALTAGQTVGFDTDVFSGGLDSYIRLFNSSGLQLRASDDDPAPGESFTLGSYIEYPVHTTGT